MTAKTKKTSKRPGPDPREGSMATWICTPFGILMPAKRPPHLVKRGDNRTLQVRTRERAYLDIFRERYCPELGTSHHYPTHDYPWKAAVAPEDLARAMARVMLDIDSEIFKPLAEKGGLSPELGRRLHDCYTSMWSTQLHYGDGTSVFDAKWHYDPKTHKPDPEACKRLGHWYPVDREACVDCGEPWTGKAKAS